MELEEDRASLVICEFCLQQQELVEALRRQHELNEEIREKNSCIEALEDTKQIQESDYKKLRADFDVVEKRTKDLAVSLWCLLALLSGVL